MVGFTPHFTPQNDDFFGRKTKGCWVASGGPVVHDEGRDFFGVCMWCFLKPFPWDPWDWYIYLTWMVDFYGAWWYINVGKYTIVPWMAWDSWKKNMTESNLEIHTPTLRNSHFRTRKVGGDGKMMVSFSRPAVICCWELLVSGRVHPGNLR